MMKSVAEIYEKKAADIILLGIGIGEDGLEGMKRKGVLTLAQNKDSSVIYGMPKVAVEAGVVAHELDIKKLGTIL